MTYYVLFVIGIADRVVHIAGVTNRPDESWMLQVGRHLLDTEDGALAGKRYLIVDRDTKYSKRFRDFIAEGGTEVIRLPPLSPNLNAFAERFVRSIKEECLAKMIFVGQGSLRYSHMTMELLNYLAGLRMEHIPYKGTGPALIDVVAGQITVMASSILSSLPQVRAGRLRPLGITSLKRSAAAPDIPTVSESGMPGFESLQWYGALVPAQTPKEVVARLHAELIHVLALPDIKERLLADGIDPIGDSPEHFARYIRDELIKWGRVAKAAGITPE
jgi:transposase InsO family protein